MAEFLTVIVISIGMAMDTFAVSITNSMTKTLNKGQFMAYPVCFAVFQGVMPLIGYFVGMTFEKYVTAIDHWIALALLGFIGIKMIIETLNDNKKKNAQNDDAAGQEVEEVSSKTQFSFGEMLVQGVATSIDALAIGISFAMTLVMSIWWAALIIAVGTLVISTVGMFIGKKFGDMLSNYAGIVGGVILVGIGLKIFLEHILG